MNRTKTLMISCCMALCLAGCATKSPEETGLHIESIPADESAPVDESASADESAQSDESVSADESAQSDESVSADESAQSDESVQSDDAISQEQALEAIKNYCVITNPDLAEMVDSDEYTIYWDVTTNEAGEIVVLYRSYTAAEIRYYINPASGETYVTERVPGIIDEEQRTDESFNVKDYMG